MAFNIDNVRIAKNVGDGPSGRAFIRPQELLWLKNNLKDGPENCFLERLDGNSMAVKDMVELTSIQWSGECSSRSFDFFEAYVAIAIKGEIVALVSWEHGEHTEIWHIKDGVFTQTDVMNVLKDPEILSLCLK